MPPCSSDLSSVLTKGRACPVQDHCQRACGPATPSRKLLSWSSPALSCAAVQAGSVPKAGPGLVPTYPRYQEVTRTGKHCHPTEHRDKQEPTARRKGLQLIQVWILPTLCFYPSQLSPPLHLPHLPKLRVPKALPSRQGKAYKHLRAVCSSGPRQLPQADRCLCSVAPCCSTPSARQMGLLHGGCRAPSTAYALQPAQAARWAGNG